MGKFAIEKVLITGGTGFIGSVLSRLFAEQGFQVYALTSSKLKAHGIVDNIRIVEGDLKNSLEIENLLQVIRPDVCIHCAWLSDKVGYWNSEENLKWVKYSILLLRAFAGCGGKRFIGLGTCAEYLWGKGPLSESDDLGPPETLYGQAKYNLGKQVLKLSEELGLSAAWARVFFCFGPREDVNRLIPSVILKLLADQVAACSDGRQLRDFLYVDDVAEAIKLLSLSDFQGVINIASGKTVELRTLLGLVEDKMQKSGLIQLGALPRRENDVEEVKAVIDKLASLSFIPKTTLEDGIIKTIQYFQNQK